jgi:hypothetical protein
VTFDRRRARPGYPPILLREKLANPKVYDECRKEDFDSRLELPIVAGAKRSHPSGATTPVGSLNLSSDSNVCRELFTIMSCPRRANASVSAPRQLGIPLRAVNGVLLLIPFRGSRGFGSGLCVERGVSGQVSDERISIPTDVVRLDCSIDGNHVLQTLS